MKSKKLKTNAWPEGRYWPEEVTLDVGSNMPLDVYGIRNTEFGVLYVRHDVVSKQLLDAYKAGMTEAAKLIEKKASEYDREYGFTDPETGTREYPKGGDQYMQEMTELSDDILTARDNKKEI